MSQVRRQVFALSFRSCVAVSQVDEAHLREKIRAEVMAEVKGGGQISALSRVRDRSAACPGPP